jgi:hypothetical protein
VNIRDIRVGMWLVFGQDKLRMTKGKAYEVLAVENDHRGAEGIVRVIDDTDVNRGFFARRFERIAIDVPQAAPAPEHHKFQIGAWVHHKDNLRRNYQVQHILPNGFMYLQEVKGVNGGFISTLHRKANQGYNPENFIAMNAPAAAPIAFADMAAERAPEAPQQAAEAAPIPKYVPKVGDRVRLAFKPDNLNAAPGWVDRVMDKLLDEQVVLTIKRIIPGNGWVKVEEDEDDFSYHPAWLEPVANARPFAVGDLIKQVGERFPDVFKVLELLDNHRICISTARDHNKVLGTWDEYLFELVRRGNGEAVAAKPAIIAPKIGEYVKVAKKVAGGKAKWLPEMDATIGKTYKVERFDDWAKTYQLSNGYSYLAECLEIGKKEDVEKKKKGPALRDLIAQSRKEDIKNVRGVSSYVVFLKNKKTGEITLNKHLSDVCHARLAVYYGGRDDVKEAVAVIDYQQAHEKQALAAGKGYKTSYRKFVDYIVNRSPWAVAFQGKTVKNVLENGVLMNVEAPSGAVAGACQALRYLSEFNAQNAVWKLMMDNGIQEDAAFLTTYAFIAEADGYTKHPMGGGHQPINGEISAGSLISFFANGYDEKFLKSTPYREQTSYRVHEHVEKVKDVLKMPEPYDTFVLKATEWTDVKANWAVVKKATEEQVIAFARNLEQLINKARAA